MDWFYSFSNPYIENINMAGKKFWEKNWHLRGGGNQFFLKLNDAVPSVWIHLHDEDVAAVKLANSFDEFLSALTTNPDYI